MNVVWSWIKWASPWVALGLAIALAAVFVRPELLQRGPATAPDAAATVGRLTAAPDSVRHIWKGDDATRARSVFSCGLMPICSKCVQLYLHGL